MLIYVDQRLSLAIYRTRHRLRDRPEKNEGQEVSMEQLEDDLSNISTRLVNFLNLGIFTLTDVR